ncbi:hypothetical protein A1O1_04133, partial [Capronia coronata CBS 617.96]
PATRPRGTKPRTSIDTLETNIASTREQLSTVLQQICKLESFHSQTRKTTQTVSPNPESQHDSARSSSLSTDDPDDEKQPAEAQAETEVEEAEALNHANAIFSRHISLLKEYNKIKDIAMGMLSLIAEKEGRRLVKVMEERGLNEND